jgi:hypothetical protein
MKLSLLRSSVTKSRRLPKVEEAQEEATVETKVRAAFDTSERRSQDPAPSSSGRSGQDRAEPGRRGRRRWRP